MASSTTSEIPTITHESSRWYAPAGARWAFVLSALLSVGFVWPYDPAATVDHWHDSAWLMGWITVLVLIGVLAGYLLRTFWSALIAPICLYAGGVTSWFQFEHGWTLPYWPEFVSASAVALGVLLLTAGAAAGIACRVEYRSVRSPDRVSGDIRLTGAFAGMLGLLSATTMAIFPLPYLGGLLGFAAALAGIAMLQEPTPNGRERSLAISGILLGSSVALVESYRVWNIARELLLISLG